VIVTQKDSSLLSDLMLRLAALHLDQIVIVINSDEEAFVLDVGNIRSIRTGKNLGAAGGFARGIEEALDLGAEWVWTSDDDAVPETHTLVADLVRFATAENIDLLAPIILVPNNHLRLSFPFRGRYCRIWDRKAISRKKFIPNQAHLFNGTLFRSAMLKVVGLPDQRLFIRGDEIDFFLRVIKAGFKAGTASDFAMIHPSGEDEMYPVLFGLLRVCIPSSTLKFMYHLRNRGFLTRKFKRIDWLLIDIIRYTCFTLLRNNPSPYAFKGTIWLYFKGFAGSLDEDLDINPLLWDKINALKRT
jgi:rhamnopyranosyl-N-acetylglucosaminyl-diphospho-decaprenol beta-1,3/1,4-galactofuranosyltransferase